MANLKICVAFDLDDTLYKERSYVISGYAAVAGRFASVAGCPPEDLLERMTSSADAFDTLLGLEAIKAAGITIEDVLEVYRSHRPSLRLPEETSATLAALSEAGVSLAVVTDGRSVSQRNKVEALGLYRFISPGAVFVSGELGADKLTPIPFLRVMETIDADRYYYVGDNPVKDFYYPNMLCWTSIMLRDNEGINVPSQDLSDIKPEFWPQVFVDSLTQIPKLCLPH